MTRRFSLVAFLSCVFGVLAMSENAHAQTMQDRMWWHGITDLSRDVTILNKAQSYADGAAGGQCKVWVQNVVFAASRRVVLLPQNNPYCDWQWYWSPDVQPIYFDRWDGVPLWPGQIIQAQVWHKDGSRGPHTMIVVSASPYTITVIESNWLGDERVRRRTATWADFKRSIIHYTLYQVK